MHFPKTLTFFFLTTLACVSPDSKKSDNNFSKIDEFSWMEQDQERLAKWIEDNDNVEKLMTEQTTRFSLNSLLAMNQESRSILNIDITTDSIFYLETIGNKNRVLRLHLETNTVSEVEAPSFPNRELSSFSVSQDSKHLISAFSRKGDEKYALVIKNLRDGSTLNHNIPIASLYNLKLLPTKEKMVYVRELDGNSTDVFRFATFFLDLSKKDAREKVIFTGSSEVKISNPQGAYHDIMFLKDVGIVIAAVTSSTSSPFKFFFKQIEDIENTEKPWVPLISDDELVRSFAHNGSSLITLVRKKDGSSIVKEIKFTNKKIIEKKTLFQSETINPSSVRASASRIFLLARDDINQKIVVLNSEGQETNTLHFSPGESVVSIITDPFERPALIEKSSYSAPNSFMMFDQEIGTLNEISALGTDLPPSNLNLERQVEWATSADGEKVPYVIIKPKDLKFSEQSRFIVHAYGAYGMPASMHYTVMRDVWYQAGGIRVFCLTRGAGDRGPLWQEQGRGPMKFNAVADTIACAEDLLAKGIALKGKLSLMTGSAGGILASAVIATRPELFASVIVQNGVLNVSDVFKSKHGQANKREYGDPTIPEEMAKIQEIDGYLHLKKGLRYPSVLVIHGLQDARVPIWQSTKFYAKLKQYLVPPESHFLWIDKEAGHSIEPTPEQLAKLSSVIYQFLDKTLK